MYTLGVVWMWIHMPSDLQALFSFPFIVLLCLFTGVAFHTSVKTYLLFRIILTSRWFEWVVLLHIKLLSLQLRNLNSGVIIQNKYYFKVNKQITWLASECLILSKIIITTWTSALCCIPKQKLGILHPQNDSQSSPSYFSLGAEKWLQAWSCNLHGLGYLVLE